MTKTRKIAEKIIQAIAKHKNDYDAIEEAERILNENLKPSK